MPVVGSVAYPTARQITKLVRSLLNDANINANAPVFVASILRNGNVVTVTTMGAHGLIAPPGNPDQVTVSGVTGGATNFNGVFNVQAVIGPTQFTYPQNGPNESGTSLTGQVGNVGQGTWATDAVLLPYVNSAYRKVQRAVTNVGQPTAIRDDVFLVVAAVGVNPDPGQEVVISDSTAPPNTLPADLQEPLKLWERPNGSTQEFDEMTDMTNKGGLPSRFQGQVLGMWEWRTDGLYFPGATQDTQIRIRYKAMFADLFDGTSSVLIRNSVDAIGYGAAAIAAQGRGSPMAKNWADVAMEATEDLVVAATRQNQRQGTRRRPYSSRSGYTPF